MKSTLIKDTTKSERIQLIKEWEETEGCESSGIDLMTYFKDYIDGVKEISEVNAAFNARYVSEIPDNDSTKTNAFCLGIILCNVSRSFDYLIYPYYPAYTS